MAKHKTHIEELVEDSDDRRRFQQELAIETITDIICERMDDHGVSRAELAERLGKSRGWVTQLLDGDKNKTVRTLSDACFALGYSLGFTTVPLEDVFYSTPRHSVTYAGIVPFSQEVSPTNTRDGTKVPVPVWQPATA